VAADRGALYVHPRIEERVNLAAKSKQSAGQADNDEK
jgi:hypothetical protein